MQDFLKPTLKTINQHAKGYKKHQKPNKTHMYSSKSVSDVVQNLLKPTRIAARTHIYSCKAS